jgi:hypothetical protein
MYAPSGWIDARRPRAGKALLWGALWVLWQAVRLPALALLLLLEPLVSLLLTAVGFLGVVAAIALKCSGDLPHFPFWGMMAFSIGSVLLLMLYHVFIELLWR